MSNLQQHKQDADMSPPVVVNIKRNLNSLMEGRTNACGKITLNASATQTTLYDNRINPLSLIFFEAQTADAAAVSASLWYDPTTVVIATPGGTGGSITLNHSSAAHADLTFGYVIFT